MPFIGLISIIRADGDYSGMMINRASQELGTLRDSRGSAGLQDRASVLPAGGTFFFAPSLTGSPPVSAGIAVVPVPF